MGKVYFKYKVVAAHGDSVAQAIESLQDKLEVPLKDEGYELQGGASITMGRGDVYIVIQTLIKFL